MPQLFQVLRCYKCLVFQVHQTKKSNKWECKLCGEKQSVKRHYALGTAKDCRIHVQKLNVMRGEIDELKINQDQDSENSDNEGNETPTIKDNYQPIKDSKWSNYIKEVETVAENSNETMSLGDAEVVLEIPKKRRKQFHNNIIKHPKVTTDDHKKIQENFKNDNALPKITPISICNNMSIQSKITQPDLLSEEPIAEEECFKTTKKVIKNKFVLPVLNKNSKWAQFTEDGEDSEEIGMAPSPSIETSQNDLLFSLCDDSDLDNVLNI